MGTEQQSWLKSFVARYGAYFNGEQATQQETADYKEIALSVAVPLCKLFEGFRSKPYICPAGYPTQGYGTVNKPDGTKVKLTDPPIDEATADEWLRTTLIRDYMMGVLKASPHLINYPRALGALSSFAYNLGVPRYRASTLKSRVNDLNWAEARVEILKWVKGVVKGKLTTLPGLVKRRTAESAYLGN